MSSPSLNSATPFVFEWPDPTGFAAFALVVGALGAVPLSLGLIALYRMRVRAWMSKTSGHDLPDGARSSNGLAPPEVKIEEIDPAEAIELPPVAERLAAAARRRTVRLATLYGVAALLYAMVASWIYLDPLREGFYLRRTLVALVVLAWPIVPTIFLVATGNRRFRWLGAPLYLVALVAVAGGDTPKALLFWLLVMGAPTVLALLIAAPRFRGVAPFAFSLVALMTAASNLAVFLAGWLLFEAGWTNPAIGTPLRLVALAAGAALGLVPLVWAARRYRRKRTSDLALLIDGWFLFLTGWLALMTAHDVGWRALWFVLAYLVYRAVLWFGFKMTRASRDADHRLLLLRVFRQREASTRLLRRLELDWRQIGSLQMIMAPDLASATLEPHDVLDFLTLRLGRKFIADEADLTMRLAEADHLPDPDGRFRVNEFFCRADTWKSALQRLVEEGPIVMDLRSFGPTNAGCRYELGTLLDVVPTRRFVLIGPGDPSDSFLTETLRELWEDLSPASPNRAPDTAPIRILRNTESGEVPIDSLMGLLAAAALADRGT